MKVKLSLVLTFLIGSVFTNVVFAQVLVPGSDLVVDCDATTLQVYVQNGIQGVTYAWHDSAIEGRVITTSKGSNLSGIFPISAINEVSGVSPNRTYTIYVRSAESDIGSVRLKVDIPESCFTSCESAYNAEVIYENTTLNQAIEGCSEAYIDISLDEVPTEDRVVSFELYGATNGVDYTEVPLLVTIPAGSLTQRVTISPVLDTDDEGIEDIFVVFDNPNLCGGIIDTGVDVTIADVPELIPGSMNLSCDAATFRVLTAPGSMGEYSWHSSANGGNVITTSIDDNLSNTFNISGIEEVNGDKPNRVFTVYLQSLDAPCGRDRVKVDIEETCPVCNDSPHRAEVTYDNEILGQAVEGCSGAEIEVTLSSFPTASNTVGFTLGGTATNGTDYTNIPNTVTILPGRTTSKIDIDALTDLLVEGTETVTLSFTTPNLCPGLTDTTVTVVIVDNNLPDVTGLSLTCDQATLQAQADAGSVGNFDWYTAETGGTLLATSTDDNPSGVINVADIDETMGSKPSRMFSIYVEDTDQQCGRRKVEIEETCTPCNNSPHRAEVTYDNEILGQAVEGCSGAEVEVTLSSFPTASNTVDFTLGGTATNGTDYTNIPNTVTILPGRTTSKIDIDALTDLLVEGSETVTLTFTTPNLCPDLTDTTVTVVIADNNLPDVTGLSLTCDQATLQAQADAGSVGNFDWYTAETGGTLLATSTDDNPSGLINVADIDETMGLKPSRMFSIYVEDTDQQCGRRKVEIEETCTPCNNSPHRAEVTYDNEILGQAVEGCSGAEIEVTLSSFPTASNTVDFTLGGTATNGTDYTNIPNTVTILPGRTTSKIDIDALTDLLVEGSETVTLSFTTPNLCPDLTDTTVTVVIADNNLPEVTGLGLACDQATLQAQADAGSVGNFDWYTAETGGTLLATSTDDNPSGVINVADIDETMGSKPSRMFSIYVEDTDQQCGRRKINITETCTPCDGPYTATVNYENLVSDEVIEGCLKAYVEVSLDEVVNSDSIVSFTIGGTAINGVDYVTIPNVVTVLGGANTAKIEINALPDELLEGEETVEISFTNPGLCPTEVNPIITATITDFKDIPVGDNRVECEQTIIQAFVLGIGDFTWFTDQSFGTELAKSVDTELSTPYNVSEITQVSGIEPERTFTVYVENEGISCNRTRVDIPEECMNLVTKSLISAPNVFTPNGDGEHDTFDISSIEDYPGATVKIFNRWGVEIYSSSNYKANEWDGGDVSDGVYFYVIEYEEIKGTKKSHTGVIHLMR